MPHLAIASGFCCARHKVYANLLLLLLVLGGYASNFSYGSSLNLECKYSKSKVAHIREHADAGDVQSQFQIAQFYSRGDCLGFSESEALKWYQEAANGGHIYSQIFLASSYYSGLYGLPKDPALAAAWYEKAANQGNGDAQFELAVLYQWGVGVPPSNSTAKRWYEKAGLQGHILAEKRACRLTPECYSKSQRQHAEGLISLRERLQQEEDERLSALEDNRSRVSKLLGNVVVWAHPFEGDVDIDNAYSRGTWTAIKFGLTPIRIVFNIMGYFCWWDCGCPSGWYHVGEQ